MKSVPPLAPIVLELRKRVGEIIAKRPPQGLAWEGSGDLGTIVAQHCVGVALEQRDEVAQRTIIEILMSRPDVRLEGLLRRHVALELARLWLDPSEFKEICRQRELTLIEIEYSLAKYERKNKTWQKAQKAGNPPPTWFERSKPEEARKRAWRRKRAELEKGFKRQALDVVAAAHGMEPESLRTSLKRGRRARKKPQP